MANRPALITQAELKRTIAGALEAGVKVGRVEVDHRAGKVVIYSVGVEDTTDDNPCDRLLK